MLFYIGTNITLCSKFKEQNRMLHLIITKYISIYGHKYIKIKGDDEALFIRREGLASLSNFMLDSKVSNDVCDEFYNTSLIRNEGIDEEDVRDIYYIIHKTFSSVLEEILIKRIKTLIILKPAVYLPYKSMKDIADYLEEEGEEKNEN